MDLNFDEIIKKIISADKAYYSTGQTELTDPEYDALKDYVLQKDPNHPILAKIGDTPSSSWGKVAHEMPMGSQSKVHTEEDFLKWASKFPEDTQFTAQLKLDGSSVSIFYSDSKFIRGVTRGDGKIGEDITGNVQRMGGLQKEIRGFKGSVRCEILLPRKDFDRINSILPEDERYMNPRNAASGISRRLDGRFCQYLTLIPYDILPSTLDYEQLAAGQLDENKKIDILTSMGFNTTKQLVGGSTEIIEGFKNIAIKRRELPIDIDGVVIKVCSKDIQNKMGSTDNRPKAQIAWKFDPPGAVTTFLEETWDVGRTGVVTPLANLEPVEIEGSKISKATLHNVAEIKRLGIGRGDTIMLIKAGDIIPKVESVIKHEGKPIEIPTKCPGCGSELENNGIQLFCVSDSCSRKNFFRIMYWIKVTAIESFGEALASVLLDRGKLNKISDLYKLKKEDIEKIEGWGDSSAEKIIQNINSTKNLGESTILTGIGIPGISEKTVDDLLTAFGTFDKLTEQSIEKITELKGFSNISATNVVVGLAKYRDEILELKQIIKPIPIVAGEGKLVGKSFCFTGAMSKPRSFFQSIVKKHGGKSSSTVTKTLSYLVCNEDAGSSKSKKAQSYGIGIITEQVFLEMAGVESLDKEEEKISGKKKVENISLF